MLRVECVYPEVKSLEDHLVSIKRIVEEYDPQRLAIDSLSALERIAPARSFREFLIGLTSFIKHRQIAGHAARPRRAPCSAGSPPPRPTSRR